MIKEQKSRLPQIRFLGTCRRPDPRKWIDPPKKDSGTKLHCQDMARVWERWAGHLGSLSFSLSDREDRRLPSQSRPSRRDNDPPPSPPSLRLRSSGIFTASEDGNRKAQPFSLGLRHRLHQQPARSCGIPSRRTVTRFASDPFER